MLPMQGAQVPSLVGELGFHMPCSMEKNKNGECVRKGREKRAEKNGP